MNATPPRAVLQNRSIPNTDTLPNTRRDYYRQLLEECHREISATHCADALRELRQLASHLEYEMNLS
jgi:hypothetical protein